MKRIIAVLLSSLMLSAAVMSGCGQSSKPSQAQSSAEKTTSAPASSQSQNTDTTEAAVSGGWTIDTEIKPVVTESQKAEFEKSINSFVNKGIKNIFQ